MQIGRKAADLCAEPAHKIKANAEGIETEEMAGMLRDIGCDYLQGFYFSKPLPVNEFVMKYSA